MVQRDSEMDSLLNVSPKPILVLVLCAGCCLVLLTQAVDAAWLKNDVTMWFFLGVFGYVLVSWMLVDRNPLVGRWTIYIGLSILVWAVYRTYDWTTFLLLEGFPIALLALQVNIKAAGLVALVESVMLIWFKQNLLPTVGYADLALVIGVLWMTIGLIVMFLTPLREMAAWARQYYQQAREVMEEVRNRKEETAQVLESLANANRQLALANKKMAVLNTIAEEAKKAKSTFVANVSHEFRTPLNMIIGLIDLMMKNPAIYDIVPSPKMQEDFTVIYRNCEHLSNMINDVLDLTRVETGRFALHREWVNLQEIIEKSMVSVRPLINKKGLYLHSECPAQLPEVFCDRIRIQQVILNLFSNAARFTDVGGIAISVASDGQQISMKVTDTGPGIGTEDAQRVFEPFWQAENTTMQQKGGSGLGLSLSREFVRLHGGRMWFESQPGVGTTFFLTIPISPFDEPVSRADRFIKDDWVWREPTFLTSQVTIHNNSVKPRVILYDKTGTLQPRFRRLSDQVDFIEIEDLNAVERNSSAQAYLINSCSMASLLPDIEKVFSRTASTPIIGGCFPGEKDQALSSGATGYLIKPVKLADIQSAIESLGKPVNHILLVDDDKDVLGLFQRMIFTYDCEIEVRCATSGKQALELSRDWVPDLILLDIIMPEMNGWEVLNAIRHNPKYADTACYFITAQDPSDARVSNFIVGALNGGIPMEKFLRCSLGLSASLMEPERVPDLASE